jgi:hypothetical protein
MERPMTKSMYQDKARVMGVLEINLLLLFIAVTAALLMLL